MVNVELKLNGDAAIYLPNGNSIKLSVRDYESTKDWLDAVAQAMREQFRKFEY